MVGIGFDFRNLSDDERRRLLIEELEHQRDVMLERAASHRRHAESERSHERGDGDGFLAWAAAYDRQAAHYQQAIDLLSAAPMPPKDEPR
jgi:hypothetical protein